MNLINNFNNNIFKSVAASCCQIKILTYNIYNFI